MAYIELFKKVYDKQALTISESKNAVYAMMSGEWEPAQTSAFLTALHMKGETSDELAGFAMAMAEKAVVVPLDGRPTIDTCGTGGDKKGSFNISTLAAFVLAGCGIPVVKHGNRAASSACGSADLLGALGMRYRLHPEEAAGAVEQIGFAFLFAPDYHPATKSVVGIRKQLGMPTLFNLLGPLTNPARPAAQLIGVYDGQVLPLMAEAIRKIDSNRRAILLHASEGWDEATLCCDFVLYPTSGKPAIKKAADFGFQPCGAEELSGGLPKENAEIAIAILQGKQSPRTDTVLLNAMLGYLVFYPDQTEQQALRAVRKSLNSGAAWNIVKRYKQTFPL